MKGDSEQNGLSELHLFSSLPIPHIAFTVGEGSPAPEDSPNYPFGTSNGGYATLLYVLWPWCLYIIPPFLQVDEGLRARFDGAGSLPPPPPPSGVGVDGDNSRPTSSTFGPITLLMLSSYLLCRRALGDWKAKEFELSQQDISCSSGHVTPTIATSFDAPPFFESALGLTNVSSPLIVDVQPPTLNSFEDSIGNGSVHFVSFDILPVLEIALSASPSPATIEFGDADAVRKLPVALYEPIHAFPNVLPFHNNMMLCRRQSHSQHCFGLLAHWKLSAVQSSSAALLPIF